MANGAIPASKITASSKLNPETQAKNGRLNYAAGPSWCAQTNDNNPYLQIDLQSLHVICAVSTQGNSKADEWVETYSIQTSTDGVHWTYYDDDGHPKIFIGNTDRNSEEKAILGVVTRWLRIVGKTKHNKFCMRAELFGVKRHPENLAFKKPTKTMGAYPYWPSRNAVDGDSQSCIHNNINVFLRNPWWRVDLGQVEPVNEVYIVNRGDCCGYRLNPFEIRVGPASRNNGITNPLCGSGLNIPQGKGVSFFCRPALFGQYVTIRVTKNARVYIHICEVEVYSARRACQMQAVGVTSRLAIPDDHLSASSSRVDFEPDKARLYGTRAWSPSNDGNPNDFLQVDLQYEFFICAVATQGYPLTSSSFWTTKYKLLFSVNGTDWLTYKENGTDKIFNGNSGSMDVVKHSLVSFTRARFVRFQPTEFNNRKALRVEIYGVPVPAGPNQTLPNFKLSPLSSTSVLASWRLPSAVSLQGITLLYKIKNTEDPFTTISLFNMSALNTRITNLGKFAEYEFHVLVLTVNGYRPVSPVKVVRTSEDVPSEGPKGVSFYEMNQTTFLISWAELARDKRNGIIIGHEIKREKASTEARSKPSIGDTTYSNSTNRHALLTGFQPGCNYSISVRAFTSVGGGPFGEKKTLKISNSLPPYWEVKTITRTEVELNWINPSLRPTEVSNYTFTYSGTEDRIKEFSVDGIVNPGSPPYERYTVTNLVQDTSYNFYFDGISSCGQRLSQIIKAKTIASGKLGPILTYMFFFCCCFFLHIGEEKLLPYYLK
ncbi:uncharacterized protein LOC114949515 isoform X2 [Acropora millepora]|uniref:uncharacterized protein LOC114949515 isoform X2 n=1 Tax=Acropora millepora TaxID=45264 RepID=UPI001CF25871|nr:uncharacterized protein LOC114949515 isoform X2 [Acropora millepora]